MIQPNYTLKDRIKNFIAGIAWQVFLWASEQTNEEFIETIMNEARAEYLSEKNSAWFTL